MGRFRSRRSLGPLFTGVRSNTPTRPLLLPPFALLGVWRAAVRFDVICGTRGLSCRNAQCQTPPGDRLFDFKDLTVYDEELDK